eukprot:CAMPEP_0174298820 /NCGR_PEP_ID=MMETSP0809-20121228/54941_1 /TAXON_ID=73025 ORGANISM="Eutreptiella gymnastica-like, Strain CCMP1594" /NCGR_SAMPLE_ID=MMETSP0809 /ASSEMBLY_ACC=CAM_ASM_000658 /LENGTH=110 /DNA_ID=CAMNT_0015403561 /DNA_START=375 /DNA_END=704 /DNA_ORIENTATION=+
MSALQRFMGSANEKLIEQEHRALQLLCLVIRSFINKLRVEYGVWCMVWCVVLRSIQGGAEWLRMSHMQPGLQVAWQASALLSQPAPGGAECLHLRSYGNGAASARKMGQV